MLLSGLLSAPFALFSIVFVPEYWNPVRVAYFLTGPEDIIFSFANGGIVWLLATYPVRQRITLCIRITRLLKRYIVCILLGIIIATISWFSGLGLMTSTLLSNLILGVLLLHKRKEFLPVSFAGAICFTFLYSVLITAYFLINPDAIQQWNTNNLWGPKILGVPLEEHVWAFSYGGVCPLLMLYVFDARIEISYRKIRNRLNHPMSFIKDASDS